MKISIAPRPMHVIYVHYAKNNKEKVVEIKEKKKNTGQRTATLPRSAQIQPLLPLPVPQAMLAPTEEKDRNGKQPLNRMEDKEALKEKREKVHLFLKHS